MPEFHWTCYVISPLGMRYRPHIIAALEREGVRISVMKYIVTNSGARGLALLINLEASTTDGLERVTRQYRTLRYSRDELRICFGFN